MKNQDISNYKKKEFYNDLKENNNLFNFFFDAPLNLQKWTIECYTEEPNNMNIFQIFQKEILYILKYYKIQKNGILQSVMIEKEKFCCDKIKPVSKEQIEFLLQYLAIKNNIKYSLIELNLDYIHIYNDRMRIKFATYNTEKIYENIEQLYLFLEFRIFHNSNTCGFFK